MSSKGSCVNGIACERFQFSPGLVGAPPTSWAPVSCSCRSAEFGVIWHLGVWKREPSFTAVSPTNNHSVPYVTFRPLLALPTQSSQLKRGILNFTQKEQTSHPLTNSRASQYCGIQGANSNIARSGWRSHYKLLIFFPLPCVSDLPFKLQSLPCWTRRESGRLVTLPFSLEQLSSWH